MSATLTALWNANARGAIRTLTWAHEAEVLLARDANSTISLFNSNGQLQGQLKFPDLIACDCAADGSGLVAASATGRLAWLALDLKPRWELQLGVRIVASAVDAFGQYLVASDSHGMLHFFDRNKNAIGQFHSPRPIHHLEFVGAVPYLACAGDFGWTGLFDLLRGDWAWSDRPVVNISQLAVGAFGDPLLLACFSEGIRSYGSGGGQRHTIKLPQKCESVGVSFDGHQVVATGASRELFTCNRKGENIKTLSTPHTSTALALSASGDRVFLGYGDGGVQCFKLSLS